MKTEPIKVYFWKVLVLLAGGSGGRTKDVTMRFRVIARNQVEAEQIGHDLAELGGHTGQLLCQAIQIEKVEGRRSLPAFSSN